MTEQEINNLIDSKIGKVKMSQLPEATQTSGLYSIGYTGNQSVKYKANLLQGDPLTVRKTYQTEAEALADKNPIDTTTSLPLKIGQFVSIVDDGEKNGIYRIGSIGGDGTMSLELQGKLGDLSEYLTIDEDGTVKKGIVEVNPKTTTDRVVDENDKLLSEHILELDSLIDGQLILKNKITNGNFQDGVTGWSYSTSNTISGVDEDGFYLERGTNTNTYLLLFQDYSNWVNALDDFYIRTEIKANSYVDYISIYDTGIHYNNIFSYVPVANEWTVISKKVNLTAGTNPFTIGFTGSSPLARISVKYVIVYNLSEIFKIENTPTEDNMNDLMLKVDGYEDNKAIPSKVITSWLLDKVENTDDKLIKGWVIAEAMAISNPTYSEDGNISSAIITWGDGVVGSLSNVVVGQYGITSIRYNRSNGDYATMNIVYDNKGEFQSQEVIITKI